MRGGAERRLVNDLKFVDKNKFNHVVVYLFRADDLKDEILDLGIEVIPLNLKPLFDWVGLKKLLKIVKSKSVDIIHSQLFFADLYARMTKLFIRKTRLISTIQSSTYEPNNDYLYSRKRRLIDSLTGRIYNDRFIAVSEFVRESIIKHLKFPAYKITVIPNYVDVDAFRHCPQERLEKVRKMLSLKEDSIILITVGRLDPPKGHIYLLQALCLITKEIKNFKLLIVGDGPNRRHLENEVRSFNLDGNVIFTGVREDINELLHLSQIFVLPTLSEGLPLTLLEALSAGICCIASDIGPVREIISSGNNGLLFPPKDVSALKDAILQLMASPEKRRRMGQRGMEGVQKRYHPQPQIAKLESLYLESLN